MPQDVGSTGTCMRPDQQKYIPSEIKYAKSVILRKKLTLQTSTRR